ncbi:MAG: HPr(Ser) kinase/phosphatase [Bacteroidetes bacterium]|nr:HPr(Ser) kinase/phosphatase [Bacteroidota bacterium]
MKQFDDIKILQQKKISVEQLCEAPIKLEKLTGDLGINNGIVDRNIYRPQLALTGYVDLFTYKQVQILGNTEIFYLKSLSKDERIKAFQTICQFPIPCMILTNNHKLEPELLNIAKKNKIAILNTPFETTKATYLLSEFLDDQFAPQAVVHASFVDVYGVGVLFVGRSGIGKSEIALDLVERGHRLVADDVVMLTKKRESIIMGTGTSLVKHFMEIRGLGVIDIRQMFGIRSIRFQKRLEIIVELLEWNEAEEYTRTGLDEAPTEIMGIEISTVKLPIFPGKNITVIAEVVAINYLLRTYGYNAARVFSDNLQTEITKNIGPKMAFQDQRHISFFQSDNE